MSLSRSVGSRGCCQPFPSPAGFPPGYRKDRAVSHTVTQSPAKPGFCRLAPTVWRKCLSARPCSELFVSPTPTKEPHRRPSRSEHADCQPSVFSLQSSYIFGIIRQVDTQTDNRTPCPRGQQRITTANGPSHSKWALWRVGPLSAILHVNIYAGFRKSLHLADCDGDPGTI